MVPLQSFAAAVLADVIRRQPPSPARTAFAWEMAVGTALARSALVTLQDGVLRVRARDAHWAREIRRADATILQRLQQLLGSDAVRAIEIVV